MSRAVVAVDVTNPAAPFRAPEASKMSVLVGAAGGEKLARLKRLKNSARNCTLELSEILGRRVFLTTEKSNTAKPGPMRILRPALPRRLAGVGRAKHSVLM